MLTPSAAQRKAPFSGQKRRKPASQVAKPVFLVHTRINYHALQPRTLQGNKRSPFDGKIGRDGQKVEAKEDMSQVIRRILKKFKPDSRLLIINDERTTVICPAQTIAPPKAKMPTRRTSGPRSGSPGCGKCRSASR